MGMWVVFLLPDAPRTAAIIALNIGMAALSSASSLGFDSVREAVDRRALATAPGCRTWAVPGRHGGCAGHRGAFDVSSGGGAYQWSDFRVAGAAIVAVWVLGMAGLLTSMAMRRRIERRAVELEAP